MADLPKQIAVLSGKGGTGKTTVTFLLASLARDVVLADCDVDAPDLHLLLSPVVERKEEFLGGREAFVDIEKCTCCGLCAEHCTFDAIVFKDKNLPYVTPFLCEGCGACYIVCPSKAIVLREKVAGQWMISKTRLGPMVHARLRPGGENSGRLVALIKEKAKEIAESKGLRWILVDGPPGIACPAISSLAGTWKALVVTEPTGSGSHDLLRVLQLIRHFGVEALVLINKFDLNQSISSDIEKRASELDVTLVGKIPYDLSFMKLAKNGLLNEDHWNLIPFKDLFQSIWERIIGGKV